MIYDWTDPIFKWNGWHWCKWIAGILVISAICYLLWQQNGAKDFNKVIADRIYTALPSGFSLHDNPSLNQY